MVESKSAGGRAFDVCNYILLGLLAFTCLYPMWHVVMGSFSDAKLLATHQGALLWPRGFSLDGYRVVLRNPNIGIGYANTLFYVVAGTVLRMTISCLGAYVLSRKEYLLRRALTVYVVFTMYFSGGMIASFLVVRAVGLYDNRMAIILPSLVNTWNMVILKTAFQRVPDSLEESARLDGANDLMILWKIILPVSKATLAVIALYYAVAEWNGWFQAMIYLRDRNKFPLQLFLREILISNTTSKTGELTGSLDAGSTLDLFIEELIRYSTIFVATFPILCVYPFIQRYFVTGVMMGSLKE
ncbi:MAG TPA: carbohydrate ABC transporter permease [Clostridia bacterium]|nr:carbohydrate ABC transporter permease [Clostridia bacterium]